MPWLWLALSTNASYSAASSAGQKFIEFLGSFYFLSYYLIMNWLGRHVSFASLSITAWWARNNYEENQSINLQNPLKPYPYNHPFNLHPEKGFEGYPVKSTQIFIGCHLIFFRVASTQIFFRVAAWKKLGVILINQKKIRWAPWK